MTGIEIGADSCVMARVHRDGGQVSVSAVHGLQPDDWPPGESGSAGHLRRVRRKKRFSRRARVVAWELKDSAAPAADPATLPSLEPLRRAGFVIDAVVSPPQALAALARQQPRGGLSAAAWMSLNRRGAAIAIMHAGELVFSRVIEWTPRPVATLRDELLQRYCLVAHLAPELRHGFDVVRAERGLAVGTVVACGDWPDLRSLTLPLIAELDMEVETLDSVEGLTVLPPAPAEVVADRAAALKLACAAALDGDPAPGTPMPIAAAVAALCALFVWGAVQSGRPGGSARPQGPERQPQVVEPERAPVQAGPQAPVQADRGRSASEMATPAPTAGRQTPLATGGGLLTDPSPPRQRGKDGAVALTEPLPIVNGIFVAPDRRLAVVDGEILREGDRVGARVLTRIEPRALVLREPSGHEIRVPIRRQYAR